MIHFIIGTVADIGEDTAIVENGGIGFAVHMPSSDLAALGIGETNVCIYTHMAVKEDDISLYGFLSGEEQEMFRLLIGISGIGPKGALNILSTMDTLTLKQAIVQENARAIAKAPGLGLKTAQKLILELKSRFEKELEFSSVTGTEIGGPGPSEAAAPSPAVQEALEALESLGFSHKEAAEAIGRVDQAADMDVSRLVSAALRNIY